MSCIPGFTGGADISFKVKKTGTFVETKFIPTTTTWEGQEATVSCEGLYPNISYTLNVFAENQYGTSLESVALNIRTLGEYKPVMKVLLTGPEFRIMA